MVSIAITPGCPAGVGPELIPKVLHKALRKSWLNENATIFWCASPELLCRHAKSAGLKVQRSKQLVIFTHENHSLVVNCRLNDTEDLGLSAMPGVVDKDVLSAQKKYLICGIDLAQKGQVSSLLTGPIRKTSLSDFDGKDYTGQTELFHAYLAKDHNPPLMCFVGGPFLLALATTHVPVCEVSKHISRKLVVEKCERLHEAMKILPSGDRSNERMVVFGLNPHAGEHGLIGSEEMESIAPAVRYLQEEGLQVSGPVAADGFFANFHRQPEERWPRAVLAMMHDQGLGPYKLLGQDNIANVTLGLKVIRTSPAHGTADDIAHQGIARPDSFFEALRIAIACA